MDHRTLKGTTVSLYRYEIPFVAPVALRGETVSARRGLVVVVRDADGRTGYGEAAPLPGFSLESIQEAEDWLLAWCEGLPPKARLEAPRSALFAISQAMVQIKSATTGWKPHRVLSGQASSFVHVNAVVLRGESLDEQIVRIARAGYRAVKLKVAGDPVQAAAYVCEVAGILQPNVALRLDANRAWSYDDALRFTRSLPVDRIDYVEEPVNEPERLAALAKESGVRIALDETLLEWNRDRLAESTFAHAFIVKPMMIGGAGEVWTVMQQAVRARARVVLSGAFETDLGRRHVLAMAGAWAPGIPHGLDTGRFLSGRLLLNSSHDGGARIRLADVFSEREKLDFSRLELVWE